MLTNVKGNHNCPLCGNVNSCAVAESGSFDAPCWCRNSIIMRGSLDQVPATQKNESCICQNCAVKFDLNEH